MPWKEMRSISLSTLAASYIKLDILPAVFTAAGRIYDVSL